MSARLPQYLLQRRWRLYWSELPPDCDLGELFVLFLACNLYGCAVCNSTGCVACVDGFGLYLPETYCYSPCPYYGVNRNGICVGKWRNTGVALTILT